MDGHGTTITFATSGFSARLIGVDGPDISRESIDETYMDTEEAKEFDPAELYDGGSVEMTVKHCIGELPPVNGPNELITIDWAGSGNTWAFSGHVTGYSGGAAIGQRMEGKMTVKVSGKVTPTPAAG
jgi:hypothetical protein